MGEPIGLIRCNMPELWGVGVMNTFMLLGRYVKMSLNRVFFAAILTLVLVQSVHAQSFRFTAIIVEGNRRIETATIQSFTGLTRGELISASDVNDAVQRVRETGLFESVGADVRGSTLVLTVMEFPTVNKVAFEGNARLDNGALSSIVRTSERRVFSSAQVTADANAIAAAYTDQGRISAMVSPRIIRRTDNRVDVVFEIEEGGVVEIERISFVGNRNFSDRRLRRVLNTKQAGVFRLLVRRDTFVQDRINFDRQVLRDFYNSRGYVDFQTLSVNPELSKTRDAFFLTFRVQEGQQFRFGEIGATSELSDADPDDFQRAIRVKSGAVYSPEIVETTIARMERRALELGLDFVRVEPRVTRNDADLTLDIDFVLSRGPRVFVERIDIEGNTTTLDRVIRRQFNIVEGDPFNPREIRASAQRIRALGFFANAEVNAREGSSSEQVVVDVDVEEQPTGSLSFGANFNSTNGLGLVGTFREANFLGRGQSVNASLNTGRTSRSLSLSFSEPSILNRDLALGFSGSYITTDNANALYDTDTINLSASLAFPVSENGRLRVSAIGESGKIKDVSTTTGIILNDAAFGRRTNYGFGYSYSFDNRRSGLNPNAGVYVRFGQDFLIGGDDRFVRTNLEMGAETTVLNEDVTLTAVLEAGALNFEGGSGSRITDRFFLNPDIFRGFESRGLGPRQNDGTNNDVLGGNFYAVARLEARFPLGLPEEYGISGGAFVDVGSVWGLDDATLAGQPASEIFYEDFSARSVVGVSLFWNTPIGPLRFNFTKPLQKEVFDTDSSFDLTISTTF